MAFIAFPNTPSLPFPIKGKRDPNMMQRYAAISSSLGERKIMHHFVVHPVHYRAVCRASGGERVLCIRAI
jgi:hypothetical protein